LLGLVCYLSLVFGLDAKVRYDNYIHIQFDGAVENLVKFRNDAQILEVKDGLRMITARSFLLPPVTANRAALICQVYSLQCEVATTNFQLVLDWEEKMNNDARKTAPKVDASMQFFVAYRNFAEFNTFFEELQAEYSELVTSLFSIGKSIQGRDIKGISITGLKNKGSVKPAIVYNAGQHAREWIAPMTVAYIAYTLLSNYSSNPEVTTLMDNFEFIIIPLVNPDGYNYTWTTDRMWRKNRRVNQGSSCMGVDTNRNWDFQWLTGGSSTNPCSETFAGPSPFSEPEETHLANYIQSHGKVQGYIDFHAAAYLFLNPWGYTSALPAANAAQWALAEDFVTSVYKVHGKSYVFGNIMNVLYQASGSSTDWVYAVADVYYTFTIELREGTSNVFILPPAQIIPQGQEIMAGVVAMGTYMFNNPPPVKSK